jgi:hypothetical protein
MAFLQVQSLVVVENIYTKCGRAHGEDHDTNHDLKWVWVNFLGLGMCCGAD